MANKLKLTSALMIAGFAFLNVLMYFTISKFWIGGSSFLPMIGELGHDGKFLFAFLVNMGVIIGAFLGAITRKEFIIRAPKLKNMPRAVIGGTLVLQLHQVLAQLVLLLVFQCFRSLHFSRHQEFCWELLLCTIF